MTFYERIQKDKVFCASVISSALNSCEYEDDDFDPKVMNFLNAQDPKEVTHDNQSGL